ncbi:MAG: sterol desaturase family protein [Bacteroidetes bacterium]|nr:sterol desaturase family protein [Bacteroidota bacterium]
MESIVAYFAHIPSAHRSFILIGGLTFFMLLESVAPFFHWQYARWKHFGVNLFFTFTTVLVNFLMASILFFSSDWVEVHHFGLLQWLPKLPLWVEVLAGLLLLDLIGAYFIHWLEHKVKLLWRFHLVHHTDPNVDTTTANRHHPGESVFRFVFTTLAIWVSGAPIYLVFMYQSLSAALSQFNHANIQFPAGLARVLGWLIVTPGMHRVHHHYVLPYTDSNFGNIFSIWDRIFGTYAWLDHTSLVFGIDTHMAPDEQSHIGSLLQLPFEPYRAPVGAKFDTENKMNQ